MWTQIHVEAPTSQLDSQNCKITSFVSLVNSLDKFSVCTTFRPYKTKRILEIFFPWAHNVNKYKKIHWHFWTLPYCHLSFVQSPFQFRHEFRWNLQRPFRDDHRSLFLLYIIILLHYTGAQQQTACLVFLTATHLALAVQEGSPLLVLHPYTNTRVCVSY